MEKAKDIDEFVSAIGDSLQMRNKVGYDLESLAYGELPQHLLDEYSEYLDLAELPEDIGEELHDWEIDVVKDLRDSLDLPKRIDPPRAWEQLEWMADYANEQTFGDRFFRYVQRALDSRHPFGAYKDVMRDYGLLKGWYRYCDECYCDYVRHEIGLK